MPDSLDALFSPLLPRLAARPLPKPGMRLELPPFAGSADALAVAALAARAGRLLVITANPLDAQRLREEIAWAAPGLRLHLLPDWETLPYDNFSPHQDLISERLSSLYAISRGETDVVLVPASTALYRMAPPSYLAAYTFFLKQGERLDVEQLRAQMTLAGYAHVTQVVSPGEFSVRGGLVDLFPMGSPLPFRIDLFDDEVESIKTFDPDTQRTVYPTGEIRLLPAREFPLDDKGRTHFRSRFRETFEGDPTRAAIYKDVSNGIAPAGIEYYLPLFFDETATLLDYLPADTTVLLHRDVPTAIAEFWRDTRSRHDLLKGDRSRPVMQPEQLFLSDEDFFSALKGRPRLLLDARADAAAEGAIALPLPDLAVERKATDPLHKLKAFQAGDGFRDGGRILLLADSPGRRETMADYLAEYGLKPDAMGDFAAFVDGGACFALGVSPLANGFMLPEAGLAVVTEAELYAATARTRTRRDSRKAATMEGWLRDLSELRVGDPVVHVSHGIGRYLGLIHMNLGEGDTEFLHLEYNGGDKLYVPVSQLHVITRYAGADPEAVDLHRLGSGQWEKAKKKAAMQVRDTAAELLALYAQRAARAGHRFDFRQHDLEAFAEGFGFETTLDQQTAIDAVVADMKSGRPMDRLVCGDVGFGKTEVALRAAFIAVQDGKQVAVLCPTTLLAEQHYQTFADRFADWPIKIAELSRFKSAKEQAEALKQLGEGKVDIIIGTHRLLQKDVEFKRLGLVIIDEEHRFGVRQKETLKQLRSEVDILTLTATPIPRTLGLAMEGLREFSVIATAPQKRLAIKTFVQPSSRGTIREAVLREFKRGGQVYFLHNEVDTIDNMRNDLEELLPEARIVVGHGQLPERELERVMRDFTQQRANLLLCTTIIETGINIPTANTIIINRADRFGLAQLHQLRGRVGRSHHQAYAYLLTQPGAKPSAQAQKRLEAITMMEDLGSGFYLAMHDLEIRGAGEVLGENQSGEIQQVGFSLYTEMLKRAVKDLQAGKEPDLSQPLEVVSEINLHTPALLPTDYCPDVQERLTLYKRLANCDTDDDLRVLQEELIDRFGELPPQTAALLETHRLRMIVKDYGVQKLDASDAQISVQFGKDAPIDPVKVIFLIQKDRSTKMAGPEKLVRRVSLPNLKERARAVKELLDAVKA
ncbi:transcription-repair coupling factor [Thauera linaloolentis]|uniref:Transcription-repair-coupling factor n=1 Tax=Thauera linaloolentis (strain DSM 12138 / JCM 21573 / CCUG 41526 / CIP 105981 / IAM 15112 / NBRC 102519 / 47Lol) TaxID=1123367 RepID=N6Y178_THAL4|nr:transcription-repair coupling factor [Thauera linaloolentis]ENO87896.1 transcription-repair coupling factor [Thauera linaloolentis 47Lol = DSM 12138]MCM8567570.1 transcription-repair coupling factor [Thauera linaloolentis]